MLNTKIYMSEWAVELSMYEWNETSKEKHWLCITFQKLIGGGRENSSEGSEAICDYP